MHRRGFEYLNAPARDVVRSARRRLRRALVVANLAGAAAVFWFVSVAVPSTAADAEATLHLDAMVVLTLSYLVAAALFVRWWFEREAGPVLTWLLAERAPAPSEQAMALDLPRRIGMVVGGGWAVAAVLLGIAEESHQRDTGLDVAIAIVLGGVASTSLTSLLAERALRAVTARALAHGPPDREVGPSVRRRLLSAWAFGTGAPLAGLAAVTAIAFAGDYGDTESFAVAVTMLVGVCLAAGLVSVLVVADSAAAGSPRCAMRWTSSSEGISARVWLRMTAARSGSCRPASTAWPPAWRSVNASATSSVATSVRTSRERR